MGERNDDVEIDEESGITVVDDSEDLIEEVVDEDGIVLEGDDDGDSNRKKFSEDEEEAYGKKVQRRINKEVQKRKVLEDRLENQEVEYERRMSEFEERFNAKEQEEEDSTVVEELKTIEDQRRENHEVGDYDQELEDKWFDLKSKQRESKGKNRKKPEKKRVEPEKNTGGEQDQAPIPGEQKKWLDSNTAWYGKNKDRSQYANAEYVKLVNEGYDPNDSDTYVELDSRLAGASSNQDTDDDVIVDDERDERPPPPAIPNRGNSNPQRKSNTFTNADKVKMREWNLDPNDPAQRKAWLSEKRSA